MSEVKIDMEFARRDDCLDRMVPSDLRLLIAERDAALAELAALKGGQELRYQFDGAVIRTEHGVWVGELIAYDDDLLNELISAPPAQASAWVPEGCPTDDMVVRGAEELHDCLRQAGVKHDFDANLGGTAKQQEIVEQVFKAMLAAAPIPGAKPCATSMPRE